MKEIKRVIDYSNMTYERVLDLPEDVFLLMLKNHIVDEFESSEEGREHLKLCKRLQETEPDEQAILKEIQKQKG